MRIQDNRRGQDAEALENATRARKDKSDENYHRSQKGKRHLLSDKEREKERRYQDVRITLSRESFRLPTH